MKFYLIAVMSIFMATSGVSQHAHGANPMAETGQAQFAVIAEIVTALRDDPHTDWERVDIDALRDHLIDMDNVTTKAQVQRIKSDRRVTFQVTGDAVVATSTQRMVIAHSPMLEQATGWGVTSEVQPDGATMALTGLSPNDFDEITALGFFGLMTAGAHHQTHHLMIATGSSPH